MTKAAQAEKESGTEINERRENLVRRGGESCRVLFKINKNRKRVDVFAEDVVNY